MTPQSASCLRARNFGIDCLRGLAAQAVAAS